MVCRLVLNNDRTYGHYEIELILNKNGELLWDYRPMPLPSPNLVQQFDNRLIREQLDYNKK